MFVDSSFRKPLNDDRTALAAYIPGLSQTATQISVPQPREWISRSSRAIRATSLSFRTRAAAVEALPAIMGSMQLVLTAGTSLGMAGAYTRCY